MGRRGWGGEGGVERVCLRWGGEGVFEMGGEGGVERVCLWWC